MFNQKGFALLILTVTVVTKSALAQQTSCHELAPMFGGLFDDCGPLEFPGRYEMCCMRGDPHITTFDRCRYKFGAPGWFTAVGDCEDEDNDLQIDVYMTPRWNGFQFRINGVKITKNGISYKFKFNRKTKTIDIIGGDDDGLSREITSTTPYWDDHLAAWVESYSPAFSSKLIIRCEDVKIVINCKFHTVYIYIKSEKIGVDLFCGLCGIVNGDDEDDKNCVANCNDACAANSEDCDIDDLGEQWMIEHEDSSSTPDGEGAGK